MILTDAEILAAMANGTIVIEPFHREALGTNSYDVHLGKTLMVYAHPGPDGVLDCARECPVEAFDIPPEGYVLYPGRLYLAVTEEYTETHKHVPYLDGKSSVARFGISVHQTAGRGDVGFCNHWTMEIGVVHPTRVYAGMPIGQLTYHECGTPLNPYNAKPGAKYNQRTDKPMPSRMFKNFVRGEDGAVRVKYK